MNTPEKNIEIAVVVPYYKGHDFITACIESIDESQVDCSIYIVDNDPDGIKSISSRNSLTIIKTLPEIGYGRAANVGVQQAVRDGAEIVVVSNQDVKFLPDTIQYLCEGINDSSRLLVHVPMLLEYDLSSISPFFTSQVLINTNYQRDLANLQVKAHYNAVGAYGACFSFPGRLYNEIGLFDPVFQMYGEDEDLFARVQRVGGEVRLIPDASLGHFHNHVNATGGDKAQIQFWAQQAHRILDIRYKNKTLPAQFIRTLKDSVKHIVGGNIKYGLLLPIFHTKYFLSTRKIRNNSATDLKKRIGDQITRDILPDSPQ